MAESSRRRSALGAVAVIALVVAAVAVWVYVFADFARISQAGSSGSSGSDASATSSPSGGESESGGSKEPDESGESEPTEDPTSLDAAREALVREGSRVLVLGDGTGNHPEEWVHQWAGQEGMPVATWRAETEDGYDGVTDATRVWSGSMPDATADYALEHLDQLWPAAQPDLVLLSYGHGYSSADGVDESLTRLHDQIAGRAPDAEVVVIVQNPSFEDADAEVREAVRQFASNERLPTIDVARAVEESDIPSADLRLDAFNPSPAGTALWVETVSAALTG